MTEFAKFEAMLRERKAYLDTQLHAFEDALDEEPSKDAEERATEREGDEVLEGLGMSGLTELRAIEAALARIENGTYGICPTCGEDIAPERLATVPHAALCRNCA